MQQQTIDQRAAPHFDAEAHIGRMAVEAIMPRLEEYGAGLQPDRYWCAVLAALSAALAQRDIGGGNG